MDVYAMVDKLNEDREFCGMRDAVLARLSHKYGRNPMQADAVAFAVRALLEGEPYAQGVLALLDKLTGNSAEVAALEVYVNGAGDPPDDLTADELTGCDCEGECHTCAEAIARRQAGV